MEFGGVSSLRLEETGEDEGIAIFGRTEGLQLEGAPVAEICRRRYWPAFETKTGTPAYGCSTMVGAQDSTELHV